MKHLLRRRDTEALIDAIIEGRPVDGDAGLEDVEAFLSEMQHEFGATPAPAPRPTLASTLDGRRPLRPESSGPRTKPTIPEPQPRRRLFRPVVVAFATSAVLFGGLATAGALPGPVQRGTAELTSHVGINLPGAPSPDDPTEPGTDVPRTGPKESPATTSPRGANVPPAPVPSTVPTPPTTLPAAPNLPTTPTTVPLPIPLPHLENLLEPLAPQQGLTGPVTRSPVLQKGLIP